MSKKVYIFLADGFEDIEGLTVVDLMRRAGIEIVTVSIKNTRVSFLDKEEDPGIFLFVDNFRLWIPSLFPAQSNDPDHC